MVDERRSERQLRLCNTILFDIGLSGRFVPLRYTTARTPSTTDLHGALNGHASAASTAACFVCALCARTPYTEVSAATPWGADPIRSEYE